MTTGNNDGENRQIHEIIKMAVQSKKSSHRQFDHDDQGHRAFDNRHRRGARIWLWLTPVAAILFGLIVLTMMGHDSVAPNGVPASLFGLPEMGDTNHSS